MTTSSSSRNASAPAAAKKPSTAWKTTTSSQASLDSSTRSSSETVTPTTFASTSRRNRRSSSAVGTEDPVSGISQARPDVAIAVELAVERGGQDRYLGMGGTQGVHALGGGDQADERDPLCALPLHPGDGLRRAAAGGQHRVDHEDLGVGRARRDVLVVADRPQGLLVAVHAEVADARVGHQPQEAVDEAEAGAQDRHQHHLVGQPRALCALERRLELILVVPQAAHRLVGEDHRRVVERLPEHAVRRLAVAQDRHQAAQQDVVDDRDPLHPRGTYRAGRRYVSIRLGRVSAPRRNVELKALDPDPARSLAVCRELGAEDHGVLRQRDTYFRARAGRLKLREEEPGGATLIQYDRPDAAAARESRYRLTSVPDPDELRASLDAALGTLVVVDKERHLLLWEGVRIHLDTVRGLGAFIELEGVAPPESDLTAERAKVARLQRELGIEEILTDSYSDRLLGADALVAAAREAMGRAHAPYSRFHVGAALRAEDGSIHAGANVENAAYPQGQCAEASAIGVLVAAGRSRVVEAAVVADSAEVCVPCGGCRQRLREFMPLDAPVHLCSATGQRETVTLERFLPLSFGPEFLPA